MIGFLGLPLFFIYFFLVLFALPHNLLLDFVYSFGVPETVLRNSRPGLKHKRFRIFDADAGIIAVSGLEVERRWGMFFSVVIPIGNVVLLLVDDGYDGLQVLVIQLLHRNYYYSYY